MPEKSLDELIADARKRLYEHSLRYPDPRKVEAIQEWRQWFDEFRADLERLEFGKNHRPSAYDIRGMAG